MEFGFLSVDEISRVTTAFELNASLTLLVFLKISGPDFWSRQASVTCHCLPVIVLGTIA